MRINNVLNQVQDIISKRIRDIDEVIKQCSRDEDLMRTALEARALELASLQLELSFSIQE